MKKQKIYIGIDVGGTKILLQTFDEKINKIDNIQVKTNTKSHADFMRSLYELIDSVFTKSVKGIGIAVPGIVNIKKGTLVHAPHLPTKKDTPLKKLIEKKYGVKAHIENDINAFIAGESKSARLKKYKNIVGVMIGTGVGGAIMADGNLIYGKNGYAGEVGHMIIGKNHPLKTFEENTGGYFVPKIAKILNTKNEISPKIKKYLIENLAIGLSNLNLIFNPEVILLSGGLYQKHLTKMGKSLENFIRKKSLDKSSPKIINGSKNNLLPKGTVILLKNN